MKPYYADDTVTLHHGDALDVLRALPDSSVDAVVTDPPYGLGFMGKEWDSGKSFVERKPVRSNTFDHVGGNHNPVDSADAARTRRVESVRFGQWCAGWAVEVFRVLKPGGHLLAFGGTRTVHRLTCAVEDAGFEIRDGIDWLYGSGFPKSLNLGDGRGTALKPAREPIVMARKPLAGTVAANVLAYGTGALNIDACRVGDGGQLKWAQPRDMGYHGGTDAGTVAATASAVGRWPSNVVLSHVGTALYTLRYDAPAQVIAYYRDHEAVREVRFSDRRDALGAGPAEVLRQGLLEPGAQGSAEKASGADGLRDLRDDVRDLPGLGAQRPPEVLLAGMPGEGSETGSDGEASHAGGPRQDGRELAHPRAVVAVEGRPIPEQGLHARTGGLATCRDAGTGSADDPERVRAGAPRDCGDDAGKAAGQGRRGAPRQRREDGQPAGEPSGAGPARSLNGAPRVRAQVPGVAGRGGAAEGGEHRLAVPPELIPAGWLRYFDGVVEAPDCGEQCVPGCPVVELDRQSGSVGANPVGRLRRAYAYRQDGQVPSDQPFDYGDSGGASRFFPVFRYEAKAPTAERPRTADGTAHPTVKPLDLMRWLVRLVTPPGGVVLEPFAGSGTTAEACVLEGFRCIAIEREAAYLPLIVARLTKPLQPSLDLFGGAA